MRKYLCSKARVFFKDSYKDFLSHEIQKHDKKTQCEDLYLISITQNFVVVFNEVGLRFINKDVINDILIYTNEPKVEQILIADREKYKPTFFGNVSLKFKLILKAMFSPSDDNNIGVDENDTIHY